MMSEEATLRPGLLTLAAEMAGELPAESNGSATIEAMAAELWQDKVVGES